MPGTITLEINGEERAVPRVPNIHELISHLGVSRDRVAVELNGRLLRRGDWEDTPVSERDRVEIVQFVGGG